MSDNFIKSKKSDMEPVTITGDTFVETAPIGSTAEDIVSDIAAAQHLSSVFQAEIERQAGELEKMRGLYREKDSIYQRTMADFDNFRRRVVIEKDALVKQANEKLIKELLPTVDNYDRSLHLPVPPEAQDFKLGMELIYKNFMAVLSVNGVDMVLSDGVKFDPNFHEAVSSADSDLPEETITSTFQKGYTLGGKVIRHAIVVVSNGRGVSQPVKSEQESEIEQEGAIEAETSEPEIENELIEEIQEAPVSESENTVDKEDTNATLIYKPEHAAAVGVEAPVDSEHKEL